MRRLLAVLALAATAAFGLSSGGGFAQSTEGPSDPVAKFTRQNAPSTPETSGIYDFKDFNFGTGITECPQAGLKKLFGEPFDRRIKDTVEQYSQGGDDRRTNEEFSCFPQNETSIDTNPAKGQEKNIVAGANDYRLGTGSSGFSASNDNGQTWYSGIIPFPSVNPAGTTQGFLVSGGDPAVVFDRAGRRLLRADRLQPRRRHQRDHRAALDERRLHLEPCLHRRPGHDAGVWRPRGPTAARRRRRLLPARQRRAINGSIPFDDKEYIAAGPRPLDTTTADPNDRIAAQCFNAAHAPTPCGSRPISPDRVYVTWTKFTATTGNIMESHSDDQGRSWSPQKPISGVASFCAFGASAGACDSNQFSTPTVHPTTGFLGVAFENFNTPDENQYLFVRSRDGGTTYEGPFFVSPVFDVNFPRAGVSNRQDCTARGQQQARIVYTNSCFRSNAGGNVVIDRRGGAFADDLYLVFSDNRNGTVFSSNADIFLFKSTDGGSTWVGPTRVNNDRSQLTAGSVNVGPPFGVLGGRDCLRPEGFVGFGVVPPALAEVCRGDFGADQWWPWIDINDFGHLNVIFHDRRLDLDSVAHEWPTSRNQPGNYLVWTWGAQCHVKNPDSRECLAPGAAVVPQPTGPINPGVDPVPGQGSTFLGSLANFGITDVPSNFDYTFRAGIFAGDYNNVAVTPTDSKAYGYWTDARNGRSSGGPAGGSGPQPGRNPICEQSDVFMDEYSSLGADAGQKQPKPEDKMFLVTRCPGDGTP